MTVNRFFICILVLPWFIMGQMPFQHPGQYGPSLSNDMYQQQLPIHQQQLPIHQQQQSQMNQQQQLQMNQQQPQINQQQPQMNQQQPQINQQQPQINQQQPQINQQQPQINQQQPQINQQQPQINQQQPQINQQQPQINQQQPQINQQQPQVNQQQLQMNQQQFQMNQQQQQYYQGNIPGPSIQAFQPPPLANQFQQPTNDHPAAQAPSPPSGSNERYLVGNLSEPFSFQVAPQSIKVTYLGLNGYSLYILGMGFSNKSKFNYDEQNNRLTILSLDRTTVGYYTAVDANWQNFVNILSAIDVSSLEIHNSRASEDNNNSSFVSCSVSIIRSTFKLTEPPSSSNNLAILPPSSLPLPSRPTSPLAGTENLPRLDLFLSTRISSLTLPNNKIPNDTLNEQVFTRTITLQRPLTRADHNGTIQCQVESNNNNDVFLIKKVPVDIEYGPNLETGAIPTVHLESETLKMISIECQIEANPNPSYVWYEILNNNMSTGGMMPYYGNQNPYGQHYPLQPPSNIPTAGLSVFGTTRQIQRIYQNAGQNIMQCQAQSRGKIIKQEFIITVNPSSSGLKAGSGSDGNRGKSYKVPMIIGISIGGILLVLLVAIIIAALIFIKRRKANATEKRSTSTEKLPNEKPGKARWGPGSNLSTDHSKYKRDVLKGDSSSTSHLVESAENSTSQAPPIPNRTSPITSTHSSYRQAPVNVSLAYRQASAFPGDRAPAPQMRSYSPDQDDVDENDSNLNTMPLTTNRSRTITPFGSHKSLSESIHSLRSNQQPALSLPTKKRSHEPPPVPPPPMVTKRDQRTPSPKSFESKKDYQHHHYHNPIQLKAQQQRITDNDISSEDEELQQQQRLNNATEDSAFLPKKFTFRVGTGPVAPSTGYNQGDSHQQHTRRVGTPPPSQKMVVHQPARVPHDEAPPSYHQVANPSSSTNSYTYQEPTEV